MPPTVHGIHPNPREILLYFFRSCSSIGGYLQETIWEGKRVVFDAAKPADWEVESAREKATKQMDQKASYKIISVSLGRAIRAS
jgi:hypothetical protein